MKIAHILPEMDEGGVEQHVLTLANGLCARGHAIVVISAGGRLVPKLAPGVRHLTLPVHRKNILTGLVCAFRLASVARREKFSLIHAHSRVPAWIAFVSRALCGVPFIVTAHARYSLNARLLPFAKADGVICVSRAVADHLSDWLPKGKPVSVIYNALPKISAPRGGENKRETRRLLCLGRLTKKKGLSVLLEALAQHKAEAWTLDIVGEGPEADELKARAGELGLQNRVDFHGHSDDPGGWMARSDLFLFPSLDEGMGISLAEAVSAGIPFIASDLPALRELLGISGDTPPSRLPLNLAAPGDAAAWTSALDRFFKDDLPAAQGFAVNLPTPEEMALLTEEFYQKLPG